MSLLGVRISQQNAEARQALMKRLGELSRAEWPGDGKRSRCHMCKSTGIKAASNDLGPLAIYPCPCTGRRGWGALWPMKDDPAMLLPVLSPDVYRRMGRDTKYLAPAQTEPKVESSNPESVSSVVVAPDLRDEE